MFDIAKLTFRRSGRLGVGLDGHDFAWRMRHMRLVAEWVRARGAAVDPLAEAARLVSEDRTRVLAQLHDRLPRPPSLADWDRLVAALALVAEAELRMEQPESGVAHLA
jgi:hypothetical protein